MRLAVLLTDSWKDDTPRLALPVREVTIMIDDNVASLTGSLRANNAFGGDYFSGERSLVLVNINRNSGLIPVGLSFKKVLLGTNRCPT